MHTLHDLRIKLVEFLITITLVFTRNSETHYFTNRIMINYTSHVTVFFLSPKRSKKYVDDFACDLLDTGTLSKFTDITVGPCTLESK